MSERIQASRRDPATEPKQAEKSLGALFSDLGSELSELVRKEFELAKAETRDEIRKTQKIVMAFGVAALAALLAILFLSHAGAWLLDQGLNTALSFLIISIIWAVVGVIAFSAGRNRMRSVEAIPQTRKTLKE